MSAENDPIFRFASNNEHLKSLGHQTQVPFGDLNITVQ